MSGSGYGSADCAVRRALEAIGDHWDPLIVEVALFEGLTRFSEFEERLQIPPAHLQARLDVFVSSGLFEFRHRSADRSKTRFALTQKGRELAPALISLATWGDRWTPSDAPLSGYTHEGCGGKLEQFIRCHGCGEVPELDELTAQSRVPNHESGNPPVVAPEEDTAPEASPVTIQIFLLGTFAIRIGDNPIVTPSVGTQRMLAYLALHDNGVTRLSMAGTMWPEVSDLNAGGSLRSALTRVDEPTREAIDSESGGLRLAEHVVVDFRESKNLARQLLGSGTEPDEAAFGSAAVASLSADLLPDWYDDWVITEAEDWRQLRTSALEVQAEWLTKVGRFAEGAEAARAAMKAEPLRESAHASLVRVHLAHGNVSEAFRAYNQFAAMLNKELGLKPTSRLTELLAPFHRS